MESLSLVEGRKEDTPIQENEVRIMVAGKMRNYITYGLALLQEKGHNSVQLKAMGRAITKTVVIAEAIKRRIAGLHQITEIGSLSFEDTSEVKEDGSQPKKIRHVSSINILLSRDQLDVNHHGYQPPLPAELVKPEDGDDLLPSLGGEGWRGYRGRGGRGGYRGRGRRGRGPRPPVGQEDGSAPQANTGDEGHVGGRGRGRGRSRRGRGRGRGRGRNPQAAPAADQAYLGQEAGLEIQY